VTPQAPALTIGVEEELFLVDKNSLQLIQTEPEDFFAACQAEFPGQVMHEFLVPQIELVSKPCHSIAQLHDELYRLRFGVQTIADQHNLALYAASTHPLANWREQVAHRKPRYDRLKDALQISAYQMVVCGMHVHIGICSEPKRQQLLNKIVWYLPYLLALSSSSPFWNSLDTGLVSYRTSVLTGLPRSGLPQHFNSSADYQQYLDILINAGVIEDSTEIWWDARISNRFPTVEMRAADTITRLDDVISVLAFYYSLIHWLDDQPDPAKRTQAVKHHLISENRWRAQRYSLDEVSFIHPEQAHLVPGRELYPHMLNQLEDTAKRVHCLNELRQLEQVLNSGTSADKQRQCYQQGLAVGQSPQDAWLAVIQEVIDQTRV